MTVEMRGFEEKFGVSFVDIPSQCLRTQSTSGVALEDLRRGSLRVYLKCLAKVIEQLLCSSTTSSTSFSWRLPRGVYLSEERGRISSSSTGGEAEMKVIHLPMKVLDDLSVCEQRAVLRAETRLHGKPTVQQELGKEWWGRKRGLYRRLVESILRNADVVHDVWLEHPVGLTYAGHSAEINLWGLVDILVFLSCRCSEEYIPSTLILEFTIHRDIDNVADRVVAYSSAIYTRYGFSTIPAIVTIKDVDEDLVGRAVLLTNSDRLGLAQRILARLVRLDELLSGNVKPRHAPHDVCRWCDTELRRGCSLYL